MSRIVTLLAAIAVSTTSVATHAADYTASPVQSEQVSIRYLRGTPTVAIDHEHGNVMVTPLDLNRGRVSFSVAAFNKGPAPGNLGVEAISAKLPDGYTTRIFTQEEMAKQASNRAAWAQFGMVLATGLLVAAAAQAGTSNYHSTTMTPHGAYTTSGSVTNSGTAAVASIAAAGSGIYAMDQIQQSLDATVANLRDQYLQTTTIDPGMSFAGVIVLEHIKKLSGTKGEPDRLALTINWNGEDYVFTFDLKKK